MNKLPTQQETFIPILEVLSAEGPLHYRQLRIRVRDKYYNRLHPTLLTQKTDKKGVNALFTKIDFAKSSLKKGKFVEYPKRGMVQITDKGKNILKTGNLTWQDLNNDPAYREYDKPEEKTTLKIDSFVENNSPQELIDYGFSKIEEDKKRELLDELRTIDPYYLQEIVLILLKEMNYGDPDPTQPKKSHDEGIDGIINEDKLGLEKIYIQTKRYKEGSKVPAKDVQSFIGAISSTGKIGKGVFVTTSSFSDSAEKVKSTADKQIILIDGDRLVDLMYEYEVGIKKSKTYEMKEIDGDFFEEFEL